jgi:hypothetical protein
MQKATNETPLFYLTVVVLAAFQGLAAFLVPPAWLLVLLIGSAVLDVALVTAYLRLTLRRERNTQGRFRHINEVLSQILSQAHSQKGTWKTLVADLSTLSSEDHEVQRVVDSLVEGLQSTDGASAIPQTLESIIDSLQTMILLNDSLLTELDAVFRFYNQAYVKSRDAEAANELHYFRLDESVEFLAEMGRENNKYSESTIIQVLDSFREITQLSKGISTDVIMAIHLLMDVDNTESLQAINRESQSISQTMEQFFHDLGDVINLSRKSMVENIAQMDRVNVMAETIADFSETIRMISLNLNIEAARATSGGSSAAGRGFQVLAVKLSEFALKAQSLAEQQREVIKTASGVIAASGQTQTVQLNALLEKIPGIQSKLVPFAGIVKNTYDQFEHVVDSMERLSVSIDGKLTGVIGKFQFQDLVRQQQSHILVMFGHIRDLALEGVCTDDCITVEQKNEALSDLLKYYESIATTENEHAAIQAYRQTHPELGGGSKKTKMTAGSVEMF